MKAATLTLTAMLVLLQYQLWFGQGGLRDSWRLADGVAAQQEENAKLAVRNDALRAHVADLREGSEALEELARSELGLVAPDESFYQFVESRPTR